MAHYLFLDFDGVFHPVGSPIDQLFSRLVLLEDWLRAHPSVSVVVSSSWRILHGIEELREFFAEDIRLRVVGATGIHWQQRFQLTGEIPIGVRHERELEVIEWLSSNHVTDAAWAALEDETGLYRPDNCRVVYCEKTSGLTANELERLESIYFTDADATNSPKTRLDVLYLDFDGVLHPESVFVSASRGIHLRDAPGRQLFENAQTLNEELRPYPNVKLVLSTSWVRALGYDRARARLPSELRERCVGATYHSRFHRPGREDGFRDVVAAPLRGQEVLADVQRRRPSRVLNFSRANTVSREDGS